MIKAKSKDKRVSEQKYEWPENYYREYDADLRLKILSDHLNDQNYQILKELYDTRYITEKQRKEEIHVDTYMRAWMMMSISANKGIGIFSKKKIIREWHEYAKEFGLDTFPNRSENQQELIRMEWRAFFHQLIEISISDKAYSSVMFGAVRMSGDSLQEKLANELEDLTEKFPQELGLDQLFLELHKCAAQVYDEIDTNMF